MNEKVRYFKIGLFALISLVCFCVGLIMFGAGSIFKAPPLIVETYFTGSVQGLDVGAVVKMSGVRVGKVREILFVREVYGKNKSAKELEGPYAMVYVLMEVESRYFPRMKARTSKDIQEVIDFLAEKQNFRAKLQSIGITGLVYVELGFYDGEQTPPPMKIDWTPNHLYVPSVPSIATRLGASVEKMLNKMDSDIYPMMENLNKASVHFPEMAVQINQALPHLVSLSKNIDDITSTGKKYPASMIFGDAPAKSRFDR